MTPLRVAVIGLGVGEQHVAAYMKNAGCQVTCLCDLSEEKLTVARTKYSGMKLTDKAEKVISDQEIDVVSIASYDDMHCEQVKKALETGKHVFVEKPLCRTLDEVRVIKSLWQRHNGKVKLTSNLVLRSAPLYKWLKLQIDAGEFGDVYAFDGDYLYGRIDKITHGWRSNVENYSVMAGGGIHLIDLLLWLTGKRPITVMVEGNHLCTNGSAFHYDDYVAATMQLESGATARITANFGCIHPHQHVVRVYGTKQTFIYDDAGPRVYRSREANTTATHVNLSALPTTKGDMIEDFISSVLHDKDITQETQHFFDGISVSSACDLALKNKTKEEVYYV